MEEIKGLFHRDVIRACSLSAAEVMQISKRNVFKRCIDINSFRECVFENIEVINSCLNLPPLSEVEKDVHFKADDSIVAADFIVHHEDESITVIIVPGEQLEAIGKCMFCVDMLEELYQNVRIAIISDNVSNSLYQTCLFNCLKISLLQYNGDVFTVMFNAWKE